MCGRDREALLGADQQVFAERPVGGRLGAGAAQHPHAAAEVAPAAAAVIALAALPGGIHHHALADGRLRHAVGHRHDFAGDFVAENERRRHGETAEAAFLEIVHIGSADAAAPHAHQHFARLQLRNGAFVDAQIFDAVQHGGQHGFAHRFYLQDLWIP